MSKPLSEDQVEAILHAARPLPPAGQAAFLEEVTEALAQCSELGIGLVYRVCREAQRKYFDPPDLSRTPRSPSLR